MPALLGIQWPWVQVAGDEVDLLRSFVGGILALGLLGLGMYLFRYPFLAVLGARAIAPRNRFEIALLVWLIVPLLLAIFSSNFIDAGSVRYLILSWVTTSVIVGRAVGYLWNRSWVIGSIVLIMWLFGVGTYGLQLRMEQWQGQNGRYAHEAIRELNELFQQYDVRGGYADYWVSYPITFLTEERTIVSPYQPNLRRNLDYERFIDHQTPIALVFADFGAVGATTTIGALIEDMRKIRPWTGPVDASLLVSLETSEVLARRSIGMWDVWIVTY